MKLITTIAAVVCGFALVVCGVVFADDPIVAQTLREDGSTNTWTQAELQQALGMVNRMYWRDMETDAGRSKCHGALFGQYVVTNDTGRVCVVQLYSDMTCFTNVAKAANNAGYDPEAAAKAKAEAAARIEAARRAWEADHLPPELAALRQGQREAESTTNEVTIVTEAN